ncbi:4Fe-4S dicluster domain-containing protein [Rhodoferax sp.]|uniref:NADH-quinone oxidoreductase subunit B family protein n=1 Tax=Rhodoferax sp. TaxID=50421 RepID=UPI0026257BBD|nr:4Fe-4S dicluster domain-containing protein [Rhodoferax sp.]MDD5478276.1 4Fe-4S dicluster domain-containing protein [Rhodoferax sp.]
MFQSIAVRKAQGSQFIPDLRAAQPGGFRGKPVIAAQACATDCHACAEVCPSSAIALNASTADAVAIDLGRCVMCGDCAPVCPSQKLSFNNDVKLCATTRAGLVVTAARPNLDPVAVSAELKKRFGRSLKLRSVSAGGCNGCEMEVNAWSNVNFDIGRYGIDLVASPRHADGIVLTGVINRNMMNALQICWDAIPEPKLVIAVGACAISGGVFADSDALNREFLDKFPPSLYVPGCPAHPLTFISGIMDVLGIAS